MRVNEFFDGVFLINLKRRFDRLIESMKELEKHGIKLEVIEAIDGNDLYLHEIISSDGSRCSNGDIACALSHKKVCEIAKERKLHNYLCLEDDIVLSENFNEYFENYLRQIPYDYDMIYLGGSHNSEVRPVSKNVVRGTKIFTTHAIGVRETMYDALIEVWEKQNEKVDIAVASLQDKFNCYAFNPFIAGQRPSYSDILNKHADYKHLRV